MFSRMKRDFCVSGGFCVVSLCVLSTRHRLVQNGCQGVTALWMTKRQPGNAHGHTKLVSS